MGEALYDSDERIRYAGIARSSGALLVLFLANHVVLLPDSDIV